jgi:hypothetical protein
MGLEKQNALIAAAGEETSVETIRFLIKRGADPNKPGGGRYQGPLHCAAAYELARVKSHPRECLRAIINGTGTSLLLS